VNAVPFIVNVAEPCWRICATGCCGRAGRVLGRAAGDLALLYAAAHPQRVAHLILLTPGLRAVGIEETDEQWRAALARRAGEPWYPDALAAVEKALATETEPPQVSSPAVAQIQWQRTRNEFRRACRAGDAAGLPGRVSDRAVDRIELAGLMMCGGPTGEDAECLVCG
jgi:pimeloyl-ACP methyl ester carboxylesterase